MGIKIVRYTDLAEENGFYRLSMEDMIADESLGITN